MEQPWKRALIEAAEILVLVAVVAGVFSLIGVGCPIRFVTGISCPGCGMTRAWVELLRLHPLAALAYHPLFWVFPLAVIACVAPARTQRGRTLRTAVAVVAIVALLGLWVVRLADPCDLQLLGNIVGPGDVVSIGKPGWLNLFC